VNESEVAITLVGGDERAVLADKAHESNDCRARSGHRGSMTATCTARRRTQRRLTYWHQQRNALIAPRRTLVEQVFGTLKRSLWLPGAVRYRGWRGTRSNCGSDV